MNYYNEIKNKLIDVETQALVKDYSKNKYTLEKYYEIGKILIKAQGGEKRAKYGDGLIKEYSKRLTNELGKKYSSTTLKYMRLFYLYIKSQPMADQLNVLPIATRLSWSHYIELLSLKNNDKISYYINKCIQNNLSRNKLRELIKSKEYERLPNDTKNKLITKEEISINDLIPNPIIIKNILNKEVISEKILQQLILEDIVSFLEQLGSGFTFIKNEYSIKLGDEYNYIDLLLYNIKYRCYVVVELKVTELKKEHTGQIMTYINYINSNIKTIEENDTIGIIICKQDNEYVIKYCTDDRIISRKYEMV